MSGFCGWLQLAPSRACEAEILLSMASALKRFDGAPVRTATVPGGGIAVVARTAEGSLHQDADTIVGVIGHARLTERALAELAATQGLAAAIARVFAADPDRVTNVLSGSFALAVIDRRAGRALLATDRAGIQSLAYSTVQDTLVFASSLDALNAFPLSEPRINRQAIYNYVHFHMVPSPHTIYAGQHRLAPGTALRWDGTQAEVRRYWQIRYTEDQERPLGELQERFRELLRDSVARLSAESQIGTFLSGGTDSSTVAGMLREVTGEPPRTYSIGFEARGFDETRYARIAADHFGTRHHEYYLTPDDVVAAVPRIAAVHDQPFGNASAVPTYYCAKMAREDGVEVLLGGDGGDELFGGNARYATQQLYSYYSDLPLSLRKSLIEPVLRAMPEVSVLGKAQRYVRTASQPMPSRYDNYNLLSRLGPPTVFTDEFLAEVEEEEPSAESERVYDMAQAESLINRMLAFDLKYTLADNDLPKVMRSCQLAGLEARFPLLDDAIVAFASELSPRLKLNGLRLRYFFKKALRDFLPPEIIAKRKHGFGMPFGTWLQGHGGLRQLALDSLAGLKKRRIVRAPFIDELTSRRVSTHPEYFGTMVWVLMMLEQWFQQHRNAP